MLSISIILNVVGVIIIIGIVWKLYEKGVIKNIRFPIIKHKFVFDHHKNGELRVSYGKYNGINNYPFLVKPGQPTEVHFDMEVEEGSVELTFKRKKHIVLEQEFDQSEQGKVTFVPEHKSYFLIVTGKHTKGACHIQILAAEDTKETINQ